MTTRRIAAAALLVFTAGCGPKPRPATAEGASKPSLVLSYEGSAFEGAAMLSVVLVASDGTKHPLQLPAHEYTARKDCSECPPDRPIVEYSPTPGGPPPRKFLPGVIAQYDNVTLSKAVIAQCPAGGNCIGVEAIPPGVYTLQLGNKLSCPGSVTVPLAGETVLRCTRP
jgi:hypothetical protein